MKIKKGIAASPGVVIAPAVVIDAEEYEVPRREVPPDLWQQELARLAKACSESKTEILDLRDRTAGQTYGCDRCQNVCPFNAAKVP